MVEIERVVAMEDRGGMNREEGVVLQSLMEVRDMFFGDPPLLRYELKVPAVTQRAAEVKGRGFIRAKNPLKIQRMGVGRVRRVEDSGVGGVYEVTINVRA